MAKGSYNAWLEQGTAGSAGNALERTLDQLYAHGPGDQIVRSAVAALRGSMRELEEARVYYDRMEGTEVGSLHVAVRAGALVAVAINVPEDRFLMRLKRETTEPPVRSEAHLSKVTRQLREYFEGERSHFDLPLDLRSVTPFQREVLQTVQEVPQGEVISYGELAERIGRPQAARAVGQALSRNPLPIVIPCHRVIAADGSLRGYTGTGGIDTKAALLRHEGAWV